MHSGTGVDKNPFFKVYPTLFLWFYPKSTLFHDLKTYFIFSVCQFLVILCLFKEKKAKNSWSKKGKKIEKNQLSITLPNSEK